MDQSSLFVNEINDGGRQSQEGNLNSPLEKDKRDSKTGRDFADALNRPHSLPTSPIDPSRTPESNDKIERIKSYQVVFQEYGGGQVAQEATITIKETQMEYVDNGGLVRDHDPAWISAEAKNTGNAPIKYTQDQLKTMANIAQTIVEVSKEENFDPTVAPEITRTETHMGTLRNSRLIIFSPPSGNRRVG
jgi:hypothetical protein